MHLSGYLDALGTMGETLSAIDAVVGLTQACHTLVVGGKVGLTGATEFALFNSTLVGNISFNETLVVVRKDAWNIKAVGTRHTILASRARDGGEMGELVGHAVKEGQLILAQRFQGSAGAYIVLQMFHEVHATEGREDARIHAEVSERPGRQAAVGFTFLEHSGHVVVELA